MKFEDFKNKTEIRELMQKAVAENNPQAFADAMSQMMECIGQEVREEYEAEIEQMKQGADGAVLASRGTRQLTTAERKYYQKLGEALRSAEPKQALLNTDLVMPETVINSVFDDLATDHPLLAKIHFAHTAGAIKMFINKNGHQEAAWGDLSDDIVKELVSGFEEIDSGLLKLTAFLPVCKATLDLGPEWLDRYVRGVLYEATANGMEAGIVSGDGNKKPVGMTRQVGEGVSVVGGVYPEKAKIKVTDLTPKTIGSLLSMVAIDPNGKSRMVKDVLFIVNPQDYFQKVMPATTIMAPDGTFRSDVMPYPMAIVQSAALKRGQAIMGIGYKYFAAAGMGKDGRIEYSDHYQFLQDNRTYISKVYANGFPLDNNAFLHLDISELREVTYKTEPVTPPTPSNDAMLSDLRVGSLTLSPAFVSDTTSYAADTTNATNTVTAIPSDAGAEVVVLLNSEEISNGAAATWKAGENTVVINVTAADGTATKAYTVTVTKA